MCFFQGEFTQWLDNSPLLFNAWFRKLQIPNYESSAYIISDVKIINKGKHTHINVTENQLTYNKDDNCTAIHISFNLRYFLWIRIPCNKTFEATFVCKKAAERKPVDFSITINPRNVTCQDGWIQIKGSSKCQILIKTPTKSISFIETKEICSSVGGSVFAVDPVVRTEPPTKIGEHIVDQLRNTLRIKSGTSIPPQYVNPVTLLELFFGEHVHQVAIQRTLAALLYTAENGDFIPLKFIASVKQKCGVLEVSPWSTYFDMPSDQGPRWGLKYRRCAEQLSDISAIICEKPFSHYSMACKSDHFQCSDSVCVLSIYVCDQVTDCFDGSDEIKCSAGQIIHSNITNNILISSILTSNYSGSQSDIYAPVHAICDGINLYNLIHHQDVCVTNRPVHIDMFAMQKRKDRVGHNMINLQWNVDTMWDLYQITMRLNTLSQNATSVHSKNMRANIIEKYLAPCRWTGERRYLEDICRINVRRSPCDKSLIQSRIKDLCQYMECPGMFKCHLYYCITMSAVCDGQPDCYHGEDEHYCRSMTCPGLLKCRGEKRCVSEQEICDGIADCLVSRDDEIMCGRCVPGCECNGYMASCDADKLILKDELTHIKGLMLKTKQPQLHLKHLNLTALIYINVSHTGIELLYFQRLCCAQSIVFADFNNNIFQSTSDLNISLFDKVIYLSFRQNLLTFFDNKQSQLKYLTLLDLSLNPLVSVNLDLNQIMQCLKIVKLESVQFYHNMKLIFSPSSLYTVEIHVTNSILCCFLSPNINCITKNTQCDCYKLIRGTYKWYFYSLVAVAMILSFITLLNHIAILNKMSKKLAKNYIIITTSKLFANVVCSVDLLCLVVADVMRVNTIQFRKGLLCILINALSFIGFEGCFMFKTYYVLIVVLKIIFPFKHQCRWLRLNVCKNSFPWVMVTALYSITLFYRYQNNAVFYDQLCSFGDCHIDTRYSDNMLLTMAAGIDIMCLLLVLASVTSFAMSVKQNNAFLNGTKLGNKTSPFKIVLKLCSPICTDICIGLYIVCVCFQKVFDLFPSEYTCLIIFIALMPINVITSSLFTLIN